MSTAIKINQADLYPAMGVYAQATAVAKMNSGMTMVKASTT